MVLFTPYVGCLGKDDGNYLENDLILLFVPYFFFFAASDKQHFP